MLDSVCVRRGSFSMGGGHFSGGSSALACRSQRVMGQKLQQETIPQHEILSIATTGRHTTRHNSCHCILGSCTEGMQGWQKTL